MNYVCLAVLISLKCAAPARKRVIWRVVLHITKATWRGLSTDHLGSINTFRSPSRLAASYFIFIRCSNFWKSFSLIFEFIPDRPPGSLLRRSFPSSAVISPGSSGTAAISTNQVSVRTWKSRTFGWIRANIYRFSSFQVKVINNGIPGGNSGAPPNGVRTITHGHPGHPLHNAASMNNTGATLPAGVSLSHHTSSHQNQTAHTPVLTQVHSPPTWRGL